MRALAAALLLLWSAPLWADPAPRFRSVDVIVDPKGQPLAAYQIEIVIRGDAQIVGVEGSEHPAFAAAPYYDSAALNQGRIVIAAFSTESDVPSQAFQAATLHIKESAPIGVEYSATLATAANASGDTLQADVSIQARSTR